jgi:carboxyl-terminal processing protease
MRVRAWLLAWATLLILLVPIAVAGTASATAERGTGVLVAGRQAFIHDGQNMVSGPVQSTALTRQAYDLLLDNFVTPPLPSALLTATAHEVGQRTAESRPGEWPAPTIAANASRDDAWIAFELWLDRVAVVMTPIMERTVLDEIAVRAMASAMAEHHTRYLDARQNEEHQAWRRGEVRYEGIGARLRRPVVLEVFEGGPAARAGLKAGDKIVAVNGESVAGGTSEAAISKIRGPLGSSVDVVVERRGVSGPLSFTIERAEIKLPFVRWSILQREDGRQFGYLQIRGFPEPSVDERVAQALSEMGQQPMHGLILDLRGNSGGRIDVGMRVASRFMQDGIVFQQLDRSGRSRQVRPTAGTYWERSVPIVTLVDGGTASMGEILSSALQENSVSRIVGTTTSGSVAGARMFPLANGGALQITVLTITSGKGVVLNDAGVTPDVQIEMSDDDLLSGVDVQLEAGIKALGAAPRRISLLPAVPTSAESRSQPILREAA